MLRRLAILLLAWPASTLQAAVAAPAGELDALVKQRLQLAPVLKGEFEQSKALKGFRNPLVSHGEFEVARGQGVWWHTLKPFESTLVVTKSRLFTRAADGTSSNVMDADAEPGLRQVNELVFALLAGDVDALAGKFAAETQAVGASGWSVTLTPSDPGIARFLARAVLSGDRFVQTVRIDETRGDSTQIRFSHQSTAAQLPAEDGARFR